MNLFLLLTEEIRIAGERTRYHMAIFDISHLGNLRPVANLPDVTVSILSNYLNYDHD